MNKTLILACFLILSCISLIAQTSSDSIYGKRITGGVQYYCKDQRIRLPEMARIMKPNEQAYLRIKDAKTANTWASVVGGLGGFLVGWNLGVGLAGGKPNWGTATFGACLIGISIPLTRRSNREARLAVEIYNKGLWDGSSKDSIPHGFDYVKKHIPQLRLDIRYITRDNFLGVPVDGYRDTVAILSKEALAALLLVAGDLKEKGYGLIVFDGYRPQRAVDHFVRWAKDIGDTLAKRKYYPSVDKNDLFKLDYIAAKSSHTRGSTVDLSLYRLNTGEEVDMGSSFDYFGPVSNHGTSLISPEQTANRNILRDAMLKNGFKLYQQEWWHYTLINEPYPDKYFNFEVR